MSSKRKRLGLIVICIILASFSFGWIIRGYSNGGNPTVDAILGVFNFPWFNATVGVNAPEYYIDGENVTENILLGANATSDHGALTGLGDDDHPQYLETGEGGVSDHGALTGLDDDDHSQYLLGDGSEEWVNASTGINAPEYYLNSENVTDILAYPEQSESYIVFEEGPIVKAKNGTTGQIDFSGTNATEILNYALATRAAGENQMQRVTLRGEFTGTTGTIRAPSYTYLDATGVFWKQAANANCDILQNTNIATTDECITIDGGIWDGNKANQASGNGFYFHGESDVKNITIKNLRVQYIKEVGLYLWSLQLHGLYDVEVWDTDSHGIYWRVVADSEADSIIVSDAIGVQWFQKYSNSNSISNVYLGGASAIGTSSPADGQMVLWSSNLNQYTNIRIDTTARHGLILYATSGSDTFNNLITNLHVTRQINSDLIYDGIKLWGPTGYVYGNKFMNFFIGKKMGGGTQYNWRYPIVEVGMCNNNTFISGEIRDSIYYPLLVGETSTIDHVVNYTIENSGSSTGTGAQQAIAHGLDVTPTVVILWDIDNGAFPYQSSAANATHIHITAVINQDYGWEAKIN